MEDKDKQVVNQNEGQATGSQTANPAETTEGETAKRIAELEAENQKLASERDNYKEGMLKAKGKISGEGSSESTEETEDERVRRIVREEEINKDIAKNNAEKDALLKKVLRENEELKLASMNRNQTSTATGSSTENTGGIVKSTIITPEQENYFRNTLKWSDKDIERYKHNLRKNGGA